MSKYNNWLVDEISLWLDKGIINADQASQISALYAGDERSSWGKIIFAALGAVVFGLGVILLFAYNWDGMHRISKLLIVLGAVGATHSMGFYYSRPSSPHRKVGESLHLLGTMLFGVGIWLVAQIYHIDEHYPNAYLVWALGALSLAWLLPSATHTMLAMGLLSIWHWLEIFSFHNLNQSALWIIAFGIIPLAWMQRIRLTLFMALIMLLFTFASIYFEVASRGSDTLIPLLISLTAAYIFFSHIAKRSRFPQGSNAIRYAGVSVFSVLLFISTFSSMDDLHFRVSLGDIPALTLVYFFLPVCAVLSLAALLFVRYQDVFKNKLDRAELAIVLAVFITSTVGAFKFTELSSFSWVIYSALFLAYSLLLIYRGSQLLQWQSTALGSLLLASYIFARFMDLFDSLLMRGLAFIVIGALLFGVGLYYSKAKEKHRV